MRAAAAQRKLVTTSSRSADRCALLYGRTRMQWLEYCWSGRAQIDRSTLTEANRGNAAAARSRSTAAVSNCNER